MQAFRWNLIVGLCLVGAAGLFPAFAADTQLSATAPEVTTIVNKMKAVFEPQKPRVATVTVTFTGGEGKKVEWKGREARTMMDEEKRTVLVMLEPADVKGTALLVQERTDATDQMWLYLPPIDRIRNIVPVETYQQFLGSDFTYADLGFVDRHGQYRLLGPEQHKGKQAYKVELVPTEQWYYSRIITWVDADTYLPLQRDFYDVANNLWRTETFDQITVIDGQPTPLRVEMKDLRQKTSTIFTMSAVQYNEQLPASLFDPLQLRLAAGRAPLALAAGEAQ
ncbi:MAG: outer membrane lipoprotein-sorting protein [Candidatus Binatia bacterium]